MKKILSYISKNKFFIILLSVIVAITLGLGFYYFQNIKPANTNEPTTNNTTSIENKATTLDTFQGTYSTDTKQIKLSWVLGQGEQSVSSIKLYHMDNMVADVSNLNSYVLNQTVYQFPGGNNDFVIKAILDSGEVIEKSTQVNIEYFTSIDCKSEPSALGVLIKLTYQYSASAKIEIPRIVATSLPYEYDFIYIDTVKEDLENGYVKETTTYEVDTSKSKTTEKVTIRWIFDSIGMSYDYPVTLSIHKNTP